MKKLLLISMLIGAMPLSMMAQDDDLYFVPKKKKAQLETVKENTRVVAPQPKAQSSYEVIDGDTTKLDVIDFTGGKGVYPSDSLQTEDYALTKQMMRFDDYDVSDNAAFWAGYNAGRSSLLWHSPWYYSRYGWYDPWYYGSWYGYSSLYSPWYYSWYDPWYNGWYDPYWSTWGWPYYGYYRWYYPHYYYGYYGHYYGGGGGHYYGRTGNAGTIDLSGRTSYRPAHRNTVSTNSARMGSLRDRAARMDGGTRVNMSGNGQRVGQRVGRRTYDNSNSSSYSRSSTYTPSRSSSSSSGSFGGGSRSSSGGFSGGSRSSGGSGGSHMGGRR
ncbi:MULTISPECIES: hypothetical protein [unclassified Prevotella]|uniref:hypothetical protein n=1 Tax=unclassified Prevotella TaxID=2638335 RepID=UPI000688C068|nr:MULTISPECIES: hypothetical protein [unclassified Prevotella]